MKIAIQIVLWALSAFFGYMIYKSINGPIEFNKTKEARFAKVIDKLKDIRDSQVAYKTVTGKYANDFNSLVTFIDTAKFTITQRRDSSYMAFDEAYGIDRLNEIVIIDTLGFVPVKDSLFGEDNRYKNMMDVPFAQNNEKFTMKAGTVEKSGFTLPVFEAKVKKDVILYDQNKTLLAQENALVSVEGVNGPEIIVGSLTEVSTNGNWPSTYDSADEQ
ncbi:hypothetical protein ACFQ1M_04835 [Sungkyunkwania multivorans]|uniref:LPS export ABC transporter periplasmic protein LptC n=1 Tax=Sungkyunkwania multivorans TaxID=1173618 RepID=A0ABW3CUR0_9FLAO